METRVAAVTGATGFLGRHLLRALAAEGWRVRALVRSDPVDPLWPDARPEVVRGDLADPQALARLCQGAQAVIHVAGVTRARRPSEFERVNVAGAARVAAAARAHAPGATFVLVSSLAAREPQLSAYARSKRDGEDAVQQVLGGGAQVVRPCAVYGPGDRATLGLIRAAATWPVLPAPKVEARICLVHAADAARAIAAFAAEPAGAPACVSDSRPDGYSWREIMTTAAAAAGARPRLLAAPALALRAAGLLGDAGSFLGASPMMTSGKVRELLHRDWSVPPSRRSPPPRFDLASGLRQTIGWYREAGWLDRKSLAP